MCYLAVHFLVQTQEKVEIDVEIGTYKSSTVSRNLFDLNLTLVLFFLQSVFFAPFQVATKAWEYLYTLISEGVMFSRKENCY